MTVHLKAGYYFEVEPQCFALYHKNPTNKTPTSLGYPTRIDRLINLVIQHNLSRLNADADMTAFLEKWQRMQTSLVEVIDSYMKAKTDYDSTLKKLAE